MRVAIAAQGRFHSFELGRALLARGHDVKLMTNYPRWAVQRFGFPGHRVKSFPTHGILSRVVTRWRGRTAHVPLEAALHRSFGRWVRRILLSEQWDVAHLWTGIGEESLRTERPTWKLSVLMRGSAHVRVQARLLEEEEHRTGAVQEKPSRWMIAREEREYAAADKICVLSTFAHETFCAEGISPEKLFVLPLGVSLRKFRAPPDVIRDRVRRIRSGAPLRVLYVGAVSFQKGFSDVAAAARVLAGHGCHFRVVGPRSPEVHELAQETRGRIDFGAKTPEAQLPSVYAWGDVFLFPTIQDGYAQVLAQAAAAGLPILTTTNCSGPELVREGENGWIVPIRRWDLIVERLQWCQQNREQLASIVYAAYERFRPRDWQAVASDFETACTKAMPKQWPAARAS